MEMKCVFAIDMFGFQWESDTITENFHISYTLQMAAKSQH